MISNKNVIQSIKNALKGGSVAEILATVLGSFINSLFKK
jgi:hypothetical protein